MTEKDIIMMIKEDKWMMNVLVEANKLNLPDWIVGAGFLRNKVWDYLHGIKRDIPNTHDIDLVYFDKDNVDEEKDMNLSRSMNGVLGLNWEIVNQAYTHKWHNRVVSYSNTAEALSEWVDTSTCVGVMLISGEPKIIAPYGINDLVNLVIRPSPSRKENLNIFTIELRVKNG